MSDFGWFMLAIIAYFVCRAVVQWRARKSWDE